jgi:hypothetical protein
MRIKIIGKSHNAPLVAWHTMHAAGTRQRRFSSRSFDTCLSTVLTSWVQTFCKRVQGIGLRSDPNIWTDRAPISIANLASSASLLTSPD